MKVEMGNRTLNTFKLLLAGFLGFMVFAFTEIRSQINSAKDSATVQQDNGLYIFYKAKPNAEIETLGQVKVTISMSGKPTELLETLEKKAEKEFPQGEGLIISDGMDHADVIKFK